MTDVLPQAQVPVEHHDVFDRKAQLDHIDNLLSQYLNFVHEYQQARAEFSKQFSSGFYSLAQANFNNSNGLRYGQDYYDERVQATRKVIVSIEADKSGLTVAVQGTKKPEGVDTMPSDTPKAEESTPQKDPIRWFGILVPQALRDTQFQFCVAMDGPVVRLVNTQRELRRLEIEISRSRKLLKKR